MHIISFAQKNLEAARQFQNATEPHGHSFMLHAQSAALSPQALDALMQQALSPFDYGFLNKHLGEAVDDLALAAHFAQSLQDRKMSSGGQNLNIPFCPNSEQAQGFSGVQNSNPQANALADLKLRLQSTPQHGVIWQQQQASRIIAGEFSAAHQLPNVPQGHQCGRLHGHTFGLSIQAQAQVTNSQLQQLWQHIHAQLHHQFLNQIQGLENPTSENLARWIWQDLKQAEPKLETITVLETKTSGSCFDGERFRIWKTQHFEAARPFDNQGRYTGDSYQLALHLAGDLDEIMGWIEDFGDVKAKFAPLYQQLDHHALDTLPELCAFDHAAIASWIGQRARPMLPNLCRVDVATGTLGASWSV